MSAEYARQAARHKISGWLVIAALSVMIFILKWRLMRWLKSVVQQFAHFLDRNHRPIRPLAPHGPPVTIEALVRRLLALTAAHAFPVAALFLAGPLFGER